MGPVSPTVTHPATLEFADSNLKTLEFVAARKTSNFTNTNGNSLDFD